MNREIMLDRLGRGQDPWDVVIVGGGATGLGCAIEAASRGYRTVLLEQSDFAKGTSSRSTKLVHGGVRYLRQGNVKLVREALHERGYLLRNAAHLVRRQPFLVPGYAWWDRAFYGIGLKMYDLLAGRHGMGRSKVVSRSRALELLPTLRPDGLDGGVLYYDGQFDDARLAVNMAQTAIEQGATVLNYMRVEGLPKAGGRVRGVVARDLETGEDYEVPARVVVNATGVFADQLRKMADPDAHDVITPSQGIHIVLDRSFLPGETALLVPKTDDGRVLFIIPWHGHVLVGTTDTPVEGIPLEPLPLAEEVRYLLEHAARYLVRAPRIEDVRSTFAGLRPLVSSKEVEDTATLSREHVLLVAKSGLLTVTGGKWTTYRKMAEDTVDQAAELAGLPPRPVVTTNLPIRGCHPDADTFGDLRHYGADAALLQELFEEDERYGEPLHPSHPVRMGEVVWATRHEMARTVEDFLARRRRVLFLDAEAAVAMAPSVAELMAEELGRDDAWQREQVHAFEKLAEGYLAGALHQPTQDREEATEFNRERS